MNLQDVIKEAKSKFEDRICLEGNYQWNGNSLDYNKLKSFILESAQPGKEILNLGWQKEGFWVWINEVCTTSGRKIKIDDYGFFKIKNTSYFVPSALKKPLNAYKYQKQIACVSKNASIDFNFLTHTVKQVHGEQAIIGVFFAIASIFQDVVEKQLYFFPHLYLYGQDATGKSSLSNLLTSFFGECRPAYEGGTTNQDLLIIKDNETINGINSFQDCLPANKNLETFFNRGFRRVGFYNERLNTYGKSNSSCIVISRHLLSSEIISKSILLEMYNNNNDEGFIQLKELAKKTLTEHTNYFLTKRDKVESQFLEKYHSFKDSLISNSLITDNRIISNYAVLAAIYDIVVFEDHNLPVFDVLGIMTRAANNQTSKLNMVFFNEKMKK